MADVIQRVEPNMARDRALNIAKELLNAGFVYRLQYENVSKRSWG